MDVAVKARAANVQDQEEANIFTSMEIMLDARHSTHGDSAMRSFEAYMISWKLMGTYSLDAWDSWRPKTR